jgi:hypothetical protein
MLICQEPLLNRDWLEKYFQYQTMMNYKDSMYVHDRDF